MFGKPEYKLVGHLTLDIGDGERNFGTERTEVYACPRCGALVFDQDKHSLSHTTSVIGLGI